MDSRKKKRIVCAISTYKSIYHDVQSNPLTNLRAGLRLELTPPHLPPTTTLTPATHSPHIPSGLGSKCLLVSFCFVLLETDPLTTKPHNRNNAVKATCPPDHMAATDPILVLRRLMRRGKKNNNRRLRYYGYARASRCARIQPVVAQTCRRGRTP